MLTRDFGLTDYNQVFADMRAFTAQRNPDTPDELWFCQHTPIFTLGLASKPEHLLNPMAIPVIQTDRGGQVTYHGPGQVVAYPLLNLHRLNIYVKEYVYRLEEATLKTLAHWGVVGHRVLGAPGIYVRVGDPFDHAVLKQGDPKHPSFIGLGKIAALGVKVTRGYAYHGLALNVSIDTAPFNQINPCGYQGLNTVSLSDFGVNAPLNEVQNALSNHINGYFS